MSLEFVFMFLLIMTPVTPRLSSIFLKSINHEIFLLFKPVFCYRETFFCNDCRCVLRFVCKKKYYLWTTQHSSAFPLINFCLIRFSCFTVSCAQTGTRDRWTYLWNKQYYFYYCSYEFRPNWTEVYFVYMLDFFKFLYCPVQ